MTTPSQDRPPVTLDLQAGPGTNAPPAETLALRQTPLVPESTEQPTRVGPGAKTPADMPKRIGRFEIEEFLGEGGFGRVYKAHDTTLKRLVALKVARPDKSEKRGEMVLAEAQASAHLMHPHIVAVFDTGHEGALRYIASAFIPGRSLQTVLEELPEGTTLPQRQAVEIVRKLAEALAYAHREGVIHRDVKPANVMLRSDGEPLLMDFGLASRGTEEGSEGGASGTPPYMSSEQWAGKAEAASDQYSLGCTLFQLLTGELPFAAGGPDHFRLLHEMQPAPSPRKFRPEVPPDLEAICLKCLEKEPAGRYANCQALADDLWRFRNGEPILARPLSVGERLVKWARRSPAVASLTAAVMLVLTLGIGVASYFAVDASNEAGRADGKADEAKKETLRADSNAKEVADKTLFAEKEAKAAKEAKANEDLANKRKEAADSQTDRAENARHAIQMDLALRAWQGHDVAEAERVLGDVAPRFQQTWETRHVRGLCLRKALPLRGHTSEVRSVCYSPDGKCVLSGSFDKTVKVWDAETGQEKLTLKGHTHYVASVCYSPDGKQVLSGSDDKTMKVWDAQTGQEKFTFKGHTGAVLSVCYSPDGKRVLSGSGDNTVKVWDAQTGQEKLALTGHTSGVHSVCYSPDGKRVLTGSFDKTVKVWDAETGREKLTLKGHTGGVLSVCYSPDGKRVLSGSDDNTLKVWDAQTGQEKLFLKGHARFVHSVCYSPDGKRVLSGSDDHTVKVWDAETGQEIRTLNGHTGYVHSVCYSPDGKRMLSGSWDGTVRVWDAETGQEKLTLKGHTLGVHSVCYSPDGKRVLSGSLDQTVKVWHAETGHVK